MSLGLKSVGKLLAQLGFTCQRPLYKTIQKDESLVKEWLRKTFPKIKTRARLEKADIFFGDAAHIRSDHHSGGHDSKFCLPGGIKLWIKDY